LIREDNKNKVGVYAWVNKVNGKVYIGSGDPLYVRLSDYFQPWYLKARYNLYIVRALSKYSMANFSLAILEYTDSENLLSCEQKWIDYFKPEYNLTPMAGNTKGYKHTQESLDKIRLAVLGRKHTEKVKLAMSTYRMGVNNPFYGKIHSENTIKLMKDSALARGTIPVTAIKVEVIDLNTKITTLYNSIREAAVALDSDIKTLLRREKVQLSKGVNTPYRKRYLINIKR